MARYIELDQDKINRLKREAQQFQDDIVCSVGTDFMENIAKAENKMIFDILKGLEDDATADVVPKSEVVTIVAQITAHEMDSYEHIYKQEVAREIFEEIDSIFRKYYEICSQTDLKLLEPILQGERFIINEMWYEVAELKKKYTESEG